MRHASFEWDIKKDLENQEKHKVSFSDAQYAFLDSKRLILEDINHHDLEERFYCIGKVKSGILTVRFTYREGNIRIFGAGFWRKGRKIYEKQNNLH